MNKHTGQYSPYNRRILYALFVALCWGGAVNAAEQLPPTSYEPLLVPEAFIADIFDVDEKELPPLRIYLPSSAHAAPVILFSHGLGGSRENNAYLGKHWSARGYVVVFLQHIGSDESVWKDLPKRQRRAALTQAASAKNLTKRVEDVKAILDALERWSKEEGHRLSGRLDMQRVGMSGHSFGALTTQIVGGQSQPLIGLRQSDQRIKAALAMSPSPPRQAFSGNAFATVAIPWMLMTGTKDGAPIGGMTPEKRREVYPALPEGDKYEVVFWGAEHSAFGDRALPGETSTRNPAHHPAILALSTAFWDAHVGGDEAAREWLKGEAPAARLDRRDIWQTK